MARPTDYTPKLATAICDELVKGYSLRKVCERPDMPDKSTVLRWAIKHEAFRDQYTQARQVRSDSKFDDLEELAATATPETVQVVKLQVDTLKWILSKELPKKYGDRQILSGDETSPLQVIVQGKDASL